MRAESDGGMILLKATRFSFGSTAAVVPTLALIIGLSAASATKSAIVSGLVIVAVADNLRDSFSIHMYQDPESLTPQEAFRSTLTNFATRLLVTLAFILPILTLLQRSPSLHRWLGLCPPDPQVHCSAIPPFPPGFPGIREETVRSNSAFHG